VFDGGHYQVYEFHPVVARLQLYCSEDLGAFYLDVLKDRLYTTAPKSLARRSAQTALWQITHAMLRWMAPFLSFTAEEAWKVVAGGESIFAETYWRFEPGADEDALLRKWARIRKVREGVNKAMERRREEGKIGSSLQANVSLWAYSTAFGDLASLGDELKYVLIASKATLNNLPDGRLLPGHDFVELKTGRLGEPDVGVAQFSVEVSADAKCERCWHYRRDVGADATHPTLCGRCISNLFGAGESRAIA
jgi:isoleucyl-tRNA synthetase